MSYYDGYYLGMAFAVVAITGVSALSWLVARAKQARMDHLVSAMEAEARVEAAERRERSEALRPARRPTEAEVR